MRVTILALAALLGAAFAQAALLGAGPALAAPLGAGPAQAAPPPDEPEQEDDGGAGYLPGARFERKLDGGPGFVCTATNALHDQQCTASCRRGETADCVDADGSGTPSCACTKG